METLFGFTGEDLRITYPEISEYEELKRLTKKELIFVWYYSNKTSPYHTIENATKKVVKCIQILKDDISEDDLERYLDLKFPAHIQNAINVMGNFDPKLRSVGKTVTGQILDNIRKAVSEDVDNYTEAGDKKSFIDMCINIGKNLPDLIKSLESGFGISNTKVKEIEEVRFDKL